MALSATIAVAVPFQKGDVFAAVNNGQVQHYNSSGGLLEILDTGLGGYTTGMAFDSSSNLYVTDFTARNVSVFNNTGALLGTFGSGYSTPESILFNATGTAYVGNLGNGIRKFDSTGNFLDTVYTLRTDWIDLASDQCTMFITDEGTNIMRYNVCTKTSLPDFATGLTHDFALRILPDNGVLVADSSNIKRYNNTGSLVQTYDVAGQDGWFALNLDPDGTSFWSGDMNSGKFFKFDIASGTVLNSVDTGKGGNNLFGLVVKGELTAAIPKLGSISGMKFNDSNGNGTRDTGELGLANWTITLKNETGSMSTEITDANGNYSFTNITAGNYTVGEVQQSGWKQTAPATGVYNVTIAGGSIITGKDFGNVQTSNKCDKKKHDDDKKKLDDDKKKLDDDKKKYDDDKKKLDNDIKKKADSKTIANDKKKYDDDKKKYDDHKKKHDDDEKKYDDHKKKYDDYDKKNKCNYDKKMY
jgi:hypothetical protein